MMTWQRLLILFVFVSNNSLIANTVVTEFPPLYLPTKQRFYFVNRHQQSLNTSSPLYFFESLNDQNAERATQSIRDDLVAVGAILTTDFILASSGVRFDILESISRRFEAKDWNTCDTRVNRIIARGASNSLIDVGFESNLRAIFEVNNSKFPMLPYENYCDRTINKVALGTVMGIVSIPFIVGLVTLIRKIDFGNCCRQQVATTPANLQLQQIVVRPAVAASSPQIRSSMPLTIPVDPPPYSVTRFGPPPIYSIGE
jgi:hypothetical protein